MTAQTVSNAVAKKDNSITAVIAERTDDYAAVLPTHIKPETWIRVAQGAVRRNPQLAKVAASNPNSLLAALMDAARQGLEPGTEQYYLVPFGGEVQGIRGYQGEIELMYRAGAVSSVIVEVVREKDGFMFRPGRDERPVHDIDWFADDRGPLIGVYAYAVMKDGATSKVVVLNKSHIAAAKKASKSSGRSDSPWVQHEEAMWLKTAAHRLTKWVPTSAEYIREQLRATAEAHRIANRPTSAPPALGDPNVIDGEIDADWPETAKPGSAA